MIEKNTSMSNYGRMTDEDIRIHSRLEFLMLAQEMAYPGWDHSYREELASMSFATRAMDRTKQRLLAWWGSELDEV